MHAAWSLCGVKPGVLELAAEELVRERLWSREVLGWEICDAGLLVAVLHV